MWTFPHGSYPQQGYGMPQGMPQGMSPQHMMHMMPQQTFAPFPMQPGAPGVAEPPAAAAGAGGKTRRKRKKRVLEGGPKKPATAFVMFSNQMREQVKADSPGISFTDIGRKLGEMWREMDTETKKGYEEQATEAKDKYMAEKKVWLETKQKGPESEMMNGMGPRMGGGMPAGMPPGMMGGMPQGMQGMPPMGMGMMPMGMQGMGMGMQPGMMTGGVEDVKQAPKQDTGDAGGQDAKQPGDDKPNGDGSVGVPGDGGLV